MRLGLIKPHFFPYSDNPYLNLMYAHQEANQFWEEQQAHKKEQEEKKEIILDKKDMEAIEKRLLRKF